MRKLAILGLAGLLSACGTVSPLTPPEGATLPDAPYGAPDKPTAQELLRRDALAAAGEAELLRRCRLDADGVHLDA